jgi:hypothetical protein
MTDDGDRQEKLAQLENLKKLGEKAYDDMYEAHPSSAATACYSDAKEFFYDAIGLARRLGLNDEADALHKRLEHIKAVFRGQFA